MPTATDFRRDSTQLNQAFPGNLLGSVYQKLRVIQWLQVLSIPLQENWAQTYNKNVLEKRRLQKRLQSKLTDAPMALYTRYYTIKYAR